MKSAKTANKTTQSPQLQHYKEKENAKTYLQAEKLNKFQKRGSESQGKET